MLAVPAGGPEVTKALLDARRQCECPGRSSNDAPDAGSGDRTTRIRGPYGCCCSMARTSARRIRTGLTAAGWAKKYNSSAILREFGLPKEKAQEARVIIPTSILGKLDPKPAADALDRIAPTGQRELLQAGRLRLLPQPEPDLDGGERGIRQSHSSEYGGEGCGVEGRPTGVREASCNLLLQRGDPPVVDILLYAGLPDGERKRSPRSRLRTRSVHNLLAQQRTGGNWHEGWVARPPMGDGDFSRTAMAIRVLQVYGQAGSQGRTPAAHTARGPLAGYGDAEDHRGPQYAASRFEVGGSGSARYGCRPEAPYTISSARTAVGLRPRTWRAMRMLRVRRCHTLHELGVAGERRGVPPRRCSTCCRRRRPTGAGS